MTLSTEMQTATERETISMVYIARLDFTDDPVLAWDGPGIFAPTTTGDAALDGQIFTSVGSLGEISNIISTESISEPVTVSLAGVDIDNEALQQIIRDKKTWRGKEAWLWMGLLDLTDPDRPIIHFPKRIKYAYMTKIQVNRDRDVGVVTVTIDEDTDRSKGRTYRYTDQQDYFPADTAATFIHKLANSPTGIHGPAWRSGTGGNRGHGAGNQDAGSTDFCFALDMQIKLSDGNYKDAGDIKIGDELCSFNTPDLIPQSEDNYLSWAAENIHGAEIETAKVNRIEIVKSPNYYLINGEIKITAFHPIFTYRFIRWQWIQAAELNRGDFLLNEDFQRIPVTSVEFIEEEIEVANIGVDNFNTYFGGSINNKSILVHNK